MSRVWPVSPAIKVTDEETKGRTTEQGPEATPQTTGHRPPTHQSATGSDPPAPVWTADFGYRGSDIDPRPPWTPAYGPYRSTIGGEGIALCFHTALLNWYSF